MSRKQKPAEVTLEKGQVWQTDRGYVEIVQMGKTLVHYRRTLTVHQKGARVSMVAISAMIEALKETEAKMISGSSSASARS